MKPFIVFLLFLSELLVLSIFIGCIWTFPLSLPTVTFIQKLVVIVSYIGSVGGPIAMMIFIGFLINDKIG